MKKPTRDRGMSLIEIMIALGVIAISLFAIMSMISHSVRVKESERELAIAKEAVQKKVDELKGQDFKTIQAAFATTPPGGVGAPFSVEGLGYPLTADKRGQGWCMMIPNADPNLIEVEVRVQWQGSFGGTNNDIPYNAPLNPPNPPSPPYPQNIGQSVIHWNTYSVRCLLTP